MSTNEDDRKLAVSAKTRPERAERAVITRLVIDGAMTVINGHAAKRPGPVPGTIAVDLGGVNLLLTTPGAPVRKRAPLRLDIWSGGRKVFAASWPLLMVSCFRDGEWIGVLLGAAHEIAPLEVN